MTLTDPLFFSQIATTFGVALGAVMGLLGVFWYFGLRRTQTQWRRREESLRADLVRTTNLLKHTGGMARVGGWELDLQTRVFTWSEETFRIHEMDSTVPLSVAESIALFTPECRPLMQAAVDAATQSGTPYDMELQKYTTKGRLIWVRVQGSAVLQEGQPVRLRGALHDITDRKNAETELRIAAIAFESQDSIFVADPNWVILRTNRAFTEMTGYSAHEAVGQFPKDLLGSGKQGPAFYEAIDQHVYSHGTWSGEVWDRRKNGEIFPGWLTITAVKSAQGQLTHFVVTMIDITQRKATEAQIATLAFYDPLTQLPNRRLLLDRLEMAMAASPRHGRKGAVLFVDLDDFKSLNDTLGHDKGDLLLVQVAQRLSTCVREGDTVARLGGDEFVVMLEDLSEEVMVAATQAEVVGEKILTVLNRHYQLGSHLHHSTPSIGITLIGERPEAIDEPLKRADLAMYQAKAAGRNTLRFFDPQMQAVVRARVALEEDLRQALAQHDFCLHYQAQMSGVNVVTGAEALLRWTHPVRGTVSPVEFIPLAEDTGLILPLGQWVLEQACEQLARWARQPATAHLMLAVNVSPRQFRHANFVAQVQWAIKASGANPARLKLELTEGLLVANIDDVIEKMRTLKALGVSFSLDDFGTGYSSLAYLKSFPLDQLKIDQSFVRDVLHDPNDAAICKMVIALADSMGLAVIAEGVETAAQRDFLTAHGCTWFQGYLFSKPVPLAEFETLLARLGGVQL